METGRGEGFPVSGAIPCVAEYDPDQYKSVNVVKLWPVKITALRPEAFHPKMGSLLSAGYDLVACENLEIPPHTTAKIPLGFATEMHPDIHCRIESRSGMAIKGLVVLTGVIDADYRGEWNVILRNVNEEPHHIAKGDRVAQAVFRQTVRVAFQTVGELSESARGAGGFGSTGR